MNTEIAVLNKINAANVINVRNTQDSNKLLVALAEEQIIEAKRKRDAEAQAINNHIRFMADAKAVMAAQADGRQLRDAGVANAVRRTRDAAQFHERSLRVSDAAHDRARQLVRDPWAATCFAASPSS